MIIDDEKWVRSVVKNAIPWKSLGFSLLAEAADGTEALVLIERYQPDLILTDIRMPGLDGFELINSIGGRAAGAKTVIITGYDDFAYAQQAVSKGVYAFITKPVDEDELLGVARQIKDEIASERKNKRRFEELQSNLSRLREIVQWNSVRQRQDHTTVHPTVDDERISKALQIVAEEYDSPLGTREVSQRVFMSEAYFSDRFGKLVGRTFTSYLAEYRIGVACKLLEQPELRVKDVARLVGFDSTNYFCQVFKRYTNQTPGALRRELSRKNA